MSYISDKVKTITTLTKSKRGVHFVLVLVSRRHGVEQPTAAKTEVEEENKLTL